MHLWHGSRGGLSAKWRSVPHMSRVALEAVKVPDEFSLSPAWNSTLATWKGQCTAMLGVPSPFHACKPPGQSQIGRRFLRAVQTARTSTMALGFMVLACKSGELQSS
ncbi:unnamed protein product, partial [Ectocarpus sp. 13 AM-2016]